MSKTEGDCGGGSAANAGGGGGGGATDEVEVGGSISRAIISPFLSSSLYYAANKETGDFLRSAAPPPKKKGWGLPVTRRARRGRRKEVAQKHFHFQFQRTSNEQMISGKGGIRQFPRGCLSPHPHSRDPPLFPCLRCGAVPPPLPFPLSVRLSVRRSGVVTSAGLRK